MKLTEFKGRSNVLGTVREVSFKDRLLTIDMGDAGCDANETLDEWAEKRAAAATAIVAALNGGTFASGSAAAAKSKPAEPEKTASNGAAKPEAKAAEPAPKKAKEAPAKADAKPAPKVEPEKPKPAAKAALDLIGDEDEPAVGDEPADDVPFTLDGELPEDLIKTGRLRSIVLFLQERGFHTEEAIVAACERLKDRIPLLSRIPVISERVKVALEVLQQDG